MTATYTYDVFSTLDGFGSPGPDGSFGGYWDKGGPDLEARRLATYATEQRMVLGGSTMRLFLHLLGGAQPDAAAQDSWVTLMRRHPTTVVSSSLEGPLDWPDATVVAGDAVEVVARLKEESDVPLRSHGSISLNRALLAAGLVDRLQVTVFPVVNAATGTKPVFADVPDLDLQLLEQRTLDGGTQELVYRPALH